MVEVVPTPASPSQVLQQIPPEQKHLGQGRMNERS
jgi:hypothetical protein